MQKRKTVNVGELLWTVNRFLSHSPNDQVGERKGNAGLLETMLHMTGNYVGFGYQFGAAGMAEDESRRVYFVSENLKADYEAREARFKKEFPEGNGSYYAPKKVS